MKTCFKLAAIAALIAGLSACETIDEERYANVACKDLKQLVSADGLKALSQSQDTGLYGLANERDNRRADNVLSVGDADRKRLAELRAAYRNNCK